MHTKLLLVDVIGSYLFAVGMLVMACFSDGLAFSLYLFASLLWGAHGSLAGTTRQAFRELEDRIKQLERRQDAPPGGGRG